MERTPIVTAEEQQIAIKLIESPLTIRNLLPTYFYQFQSGDVSEESLRMYEDFIDFLSTNEELVINEPTISRDDYIKGFQKALAMFKLWMDSIYLNTKE